MTLIFPTRLPRASRRRFDSAASLLVVRRGVRFYSARGMGTLSPLGQAIAKAEGFGKPGAVPTLANNPGDLELGDVGYGVTKAAGGQLITNFRTLAAGEAALENQINKIASGTSTAGYQPGWSIAQVGNLYSGSTSGNWAKNVAAALGVSPDTSFASVASGAPASSATSFSIPTESSDTSFSDLLAGLTPSTDNTPYLIAVVIGLAALTWAVSD